ERLPRPCAQLRPVLRFERAQDRGDRLVAEMAIDRRMQALERGRGQLASDVRVGEAAIDRIGRADRGAREAQVDAELAGAVREEPAPAHVRKEADRGL